MKTGSGKMLNILDRNRSRCWLFLKKFTKGIPMGTVIISFSLVVIGLLPFRAIAIQPEIHSITNKNGATVQYFQFKFTTENIKLPKDFPRRRQLDETADNFNYGQFEVFIPKNQLKLPQLCKKNYIVRMGQTLDLNDGESIKDKQQLFYTLAKVASGELKEHSVSIKISYKTGCNLFFRTSKGQYIPFIGLVK